MKCRGYVLLVLICLSTVANGQYTKEFKRIFFDAGYLYETGFYEEAFNRYKNLLTLDPGNCNILFLCGACCLNIPGNETQAITYLQEASAGVSPDYKDNKHKETTSPVMTWFMLGRAYHLHDEFDRAIEYYQKYLDSGKEEDPLQLEYASLQMDACKLAKKTYSKSPSFSFQSVLDHFDEDLPSCSNPVVSGDGNILIFLVDYPNDKKIMMTHKEGDYWTRPRIINREIGMVGETYPVCLSYDGTQLYVAHQFYAHSDIFVSTFERGKWSEASDVGYNVNGRTNEIHASISKDGTKLYFVSDARGTLGSFDIFVSELDEDGEWGPPENLGPVINTPYEENTPFISSNDSILFFSSQGHSSVGGSDVFFSELGSDGTWGEPKSLGFPVNTTADNLFFNPGWDELDSYYAVRRDDDPTSNTINMVIELEPSEEEGEMLARSDTTLGDEQGTGESTMAMVIPPLPDSDAKASLQKTDAAQVLQPVSQQVSQPVSQPVSQQANFQAASLERAIEPEETDEIHFALNSGRMREEESNVEDIGSPVTPQASTAETKITPPVMIASKTVGPAASMQLQTSVFFEHNESSLDMSAKLELEKVLELMREYPESTVMLTGHADETGYPDYNYLISCRRADRAASYLQSRGISPSRIEKDARGEEDPVAINRNSDGSDAPLGRYINRQVSISIVNNAPMQASLSGGFVPSRLRVMYKGDYPSSYKFTVQFFTTRTRPVMESFDSVQNVSGYNCKDGFIRYTSGEFDSYELAKQALAELKQVGFEDAFIQTVGWFERASR